MKPRLHFLWTCLLLALSGLGPAVAAAAGPAADFRHLQRDLNEALLSLYAGNASGEGKVAADLGAIREGLKEGEARTLLDRLEQPDCRLSAAARIGQARGFLQHVAALEMIGAQRADRLAEARQWRVLVTVPPFVDGVDSALLLRDSSAVRGGPDAVSVVLAQEYLQWDTLRIRQSLDFLQKQVSLGTATQPVVDAYGAEIAALASFPPGLTRWAGLKASPVAGIAPLAWVPRTDAAGQSRAVVAWRENVEASLPNLLKPDDVARLERLLARVIKLVPREYESGIVDGRMMIPLEYRQAIQFAGQAQTLVNALAPAWQETKPEAYRKSRGELGERIARVQSLLAAQSPPGELRAETEQLLAVLDGRFQINARREGGSRGVIEETALEVRSALDASLAAARADQWRKAEALRLDAYTAFDTEIEPRVLPRDPDRGRGAARGFLDGTPDSPGIKALLDRQAPMTEIEAAYGRSLTAVDECMELLKVSVSPATVGFTAFTIVGREGLEAIVILAAVLAALRGPQQASTRRGIVRGSLVALGATVLTFWLSRTAIASLVRFGDRLEAIVSVFAVMILLIVTNWVFHRFYWSEWNAKLRALSKKAQGFQRTPWEGAALLGVGFLTVYREGFEMALFLQSLLLEGGAMAVLTGGACAAALLAVVGLVTFRYGMTLPYRKLLIVTGCLVVSIMATFIGSAVRLFQTVGWLPIHPIPHLVFPNWVGLWFGLYPSWEGILLPPLALAYVGGAWLWTRVQAQMGQQEIRRKLERQPYALAATARGHLSN